MQFVTDLIAAAVPVFFIVCGVAVFALLIDLLVTAWRLYPRIKDDLDKCDQ